MDSPKDSNEYNLTVSTIEADTNVKVETTHEEIISDDSKSDLFEESGNKTENIVLENPESVSISSLSEANASDVPNKPIENGTLVVSEDKLEPQKEVVPQPVIKSPRSSPWESAKNLVLNKGAIDTAAPIKSVKAAVSKFGGIVDWKAHKVQSVEKHKFIQDELDRAREDIPMYKTQSQSAEEAKNLVLKELDSSKRLIEELKLSLERAQIEEQQAKQDAELAILRTEELENGIKDDASVAAKAQLEVAHARHEAALTELKSVTQELEQLRKDYNFLVSEKESAVEKAEEAGLASKEAEKTVEELNIELISTKELLELAHKDHLEAEEKRVGASMAREEDNHNWENELKLAEEELERLIKGISSSRELKSKLDDASLLLKNLKAELGAYMESKLKEDNEKTEEKTHLDIQEAIKTVSEELLEIKANIEKATNEINILKVAETSSNLELEEQKSELENIKQSEGMASVALSSLEAEFNKIKSEILVVDTREKEIRERLPDLRKELEEATREADVAKSTVEVAQEELRKVNEEADLAKAEASTIESKVLAAVKEIEVAKASEKLAFSAINALRESEQNEGPSDGVVLSVEEYYGFSKRSHEAEEKANERVANAVAQVEAAKESELKSLKKLEELNKEIALQKEEMENAIRKAEKSEKGKLDMEQELRKWRAEHEEMREKEETANKTNTDLQNIPKSAHQRTDSNEYISDTNSETDTSLEVKTTKKKKKSIFPRFFMFMGKKKSQAAKST